MKKSPRDKITVFDVAKKAGVSIATVSRSFTSPGVVGSAKATAKLMLEDLA